MKNESGFPGMLECFFTQRLIAQRRVSSHTIASYRDTFRLLLQPSAADPHRACSQLEAARRVRQQRRQQAALQSSLHTAGTELQ